VATTNDLKNGLVLNIDGQLWSVLEFQHVKPETVGTAASFLLENQDAVVGLHEGTPLYVELPAAVALNIEYTEPGVQGDRSSGGSKPARLETGYEINVPLFITTGEKVKVDTRDGSYLGRA
jgi:elongation factor P